MNFETIPILSYSFENKKSGLATKNEQGFQLSLNKLNSWLGVKLECNFKKDGIYVIKFVASAEIVNSLLEVNIPIGSDRIRVASFKLTDTETKNYLFLTPFDSKHISFAYSTFGGFSTGKIWIKHVEIFDMFPVKDREDLKEKIQYFGPWYHQLNLNGIKTREISKTIPGIVKQKGYSKTFSEQDDINHPWWKWSVIKNWIPEDLSGKKILDIACNNGFYSFELAKRGAKVLGFDHSYKDIVKAIFAKRILEINSVDFSYGVIKDITGKFKSWYDIVLCLGYLYHSWEPENVIKNIAHMTNFAIFETVALQNTDEKNLLKNLEISKDGYIPTVNWLNDCLNRAGFTDVKHYVIREPGRHGFVCKK